MSILRSFAPISKADLKRAAFWGLRLPSPVVVAKPLDLTNLVIVVSGPHEVVSVRATVPRPADVREMAAWLAVAEATPDVDPDDVEGDPSTWPAWVDADRWTITEDVEPEPSRVAATMTDEDFRAWKRDRAAEYRPTAGPDFVPAPDDDAERLGFELALAEEDARPPADWAFSRLRRFFDGQIAGERLALAELEAWLDRRDEERLVETFGGPIRDRDLYRCGAVS